MSGSAPRMASYAAVPPEGRNASSARPTTSGALVQRVRVAEQAILSAGNGDGEERQRDEQTAAAGSAHALILPCVVAAEPVDRLDSAFVMIGRQQRHSGHFARGHLELCRCDDFV